MTPITILLAEDHAIVREGLRILLEMEDDFRVIDEAENGRQAVELTKKLRPDVVVMDIAMPLLNGIEACRQILSNAPETRILILSAHSDEVYFDTLMKIGVSGYLTKQSVAHSLPTAIRNVHKGKPFFSPAIDNRIARRRQNALDSTGTSGNKGDLHLTQREREVLQLVAEGKANKETASELGISIKTVEKHRHSLMGKLDIHDTASLTRYAIESGVIESSVQLTILD